MEHINLLGSFGEISTDKTINILRDLNLYDLGHTRCEYFSEKSHLRSLSFALSLLNDPKVLLLDEPTAGIDPEQGRTIWNLIQKGKKDGITILTTHDGEEAEMLSDGMYIMAHGDMKASGSSHFLKNAYNLGYYLKIYKNSKKDNYSDLKYFIEESFPQSEVLSEMATELIYKISNTGTKDIQEFLVELEQK